MCLGIPLRVEKVDGSKGVVGSGSLRREVDLSLIEGISVGDYVIVHAGFAIEKLDRKKAIQTLEIIKEMVSLR